jgi:hypothetical protein
MGYWQRHGEAVRQRRNEMRAARGMPPLRERRGEPEQNEFELPPLCEEAGGLAGQKEPRADELQAELQQCESGLDDQRRLIGELKDYAEQLQNRVVELIAGNEPMAKALLLPGVKTFLLQRFHPDKYPDADERQHELLTEAMKTITAAYTCAAELHTSE